MNHADPSTGCRALLAGWGMAAPSAARLVEVDEAGLADAVKALPARGGIARGLGRSYGDPAQNSGGHVLRLTPPHDAVTVDDTAGTVTVSAGVSIDDLLAIIEKLAARRCSWPFTPVRRAVVAPQI